MRLHRSDTMSTPLISVNKGRNEVAGLLFGTTGCAARAPAPAGSTAL